MQNLDTVAAGTDHEGFPLLLADQSRPNRQTRLREVIQWVLGSKTTGPGYAALDWVRRTKLAVVLRLVLARAVRVVEDVTRAPRDIRVVAKGARGTSSRQFPLL